MSDFAILVDYLTTIPENPTFQSDTLLIAGNSLPQLIISAAQFCQRENAVKRVIFVGGIGHGTEPLITNCKKFYPALVRPEWDQLSEAEITQEIFLQFCSRKLTFLLERKSTNTGENARFSYELFNKDTPKKLLVSSGSHGPKTQPCHLQQRMAIASISNPAALF